MTNPSIEEKRWPIYLYRKESDEWKKHGYPTSSSAGKHRRLTTTTRSTSVAPRKGCIVFPDLRQKFSMKSETDHGTVIRRDNKILLVSKRRTRALLLEFQSLEDCLSFSDQFVRLNPRKSLLPSSRNDNAVFNNRPIHYSQQRNGKIAQTVVGDQGHREVVSWIVKMLHDKSFLSYVHKIESHIAATEDGMQILQGLEQRELS